MSDEERTGTCVVCQERDPLPDLTPVCGPCRSRVAGQLRDIPALVDELHGEPLADLTEGSERIEEKADHLVVLSDDVEVFIPGTPYNPADGLAAVVRLERFHLLEVNAGAVPGQSSAPRVSSSREAPIPISVDRTDLLSDARVLNLTKAYEQQREDQIGYLAAATVLDGWCRDFAETRRETVPAPIVAAQCRWLGDRLDWAFASHSAVDELAGEVADLWQVLRRAAGLTMPQPELCAGVPCRRVDCDLKTLYRVPGSDYIECASCGLLLTVDEYAAWCALLAAAARKTVVPRP